MLEKIHSIFKEYGFDEFNDFEFINVFDAAYKNSEEVYLIKVYDELPTKQIIDDLQNEYIYLHVLKLSNNSTYKFNYNLVICCPLLNIKNKADVVPLENDRFNCRKIILNTKDDDSIKNDIQILPFVNINQTIKHSIALMDLMRMDFGDAKCNILYNANIDSEEMKKQLIEVGL